jgi:quercetin dioxygenase-like cupin family protein
MRRLMAGVDASGRSCLVEESELAMELAPTGKQLFSMVFGTESSPPPARPIGHAKFNDIGLPPGVLRWFMVEFLPDGDYEMHHTDTIDLAFVIEGSIVFGLDDGEYQLQAGDCVVIPGVDHSWRPGATSCRLIISTIGTPPPA